MQVKVVGASAIDEPCICRACGHPFAASDALTRLNAATGDLTDGLLICCPSCMSDDIRPRSALEFS